MSKPVLHVFLAIGEGCERESHALRATLEYFGIQITIRWIGRPNDLIHILSGQDELRNMDYLILNFHGDDGRFCLNELADEVYEKDEPRIKFFTAQNLKKVAKLNGLKVISAGCSLGAKDLAQAILQSGAELYLAPKGYIDGNANLMFLIQFFYEITNGKPICEAVEIARAINEETGLYQLYQ